MRDLPTVKMMNFGMKPHKSVTNVSQIVEIVMIIVLVMNVKVIIELRKPVPVFLVINPTQKEGTVILLPNNLVKQ